MYVNVHSVYIVQCTYIYVDKCVRKQNYIDSMYGLYLFLFLHCLQIWYAAVNNFYERFYILLYICVFIMYVCVCYTMAIG